MATKGYKNACKKEYIETNNADHGSRVGIFFVNRGLCTFVKQVRHVQEIGGMMAIIMDNITKELEDVDDFFMADDGTGNDIHIPSALMDKDDSDIFRKYFADNGESSVTLKIDFNEYDKRRIVN
jgi:hypothetical protein